MSVYSNPVTRVDRDLVLVRENLPTLISSPDKFFKNLRVGSGRVPVESIPLSYNEIQNKFRHFPIQKFLDFLVRVEKVGSYRRDRIFDKVLCAGHRTHTPIRHPCTTNLDSLVSPIPSFGRPLVSSWHSLTPNHPTSHPLHRFQVQGPRQTCPT